MVSRTASFLLSACDKTGGEELEKEMLSYIMLSFYKLFRIMGYDSDSKDEFKIPSITAENLTDSVIMNICASIKLKSSRNPETVMPDKCFKELIRSSENKLSELMTKL